MKPTFESTFPVEWLQDIIFPVSRKWRFWLRGLIGQMQRVKGWDNNGRLMYAGWWDCRTKRTYLTYLRMELEGVDTAKK